MNADEARTQAQAALRARLSAWRVPDPGIKANEYIADMVRAGWHWVHPEGRPVPPKPHDACLTCGRHLNGCICGEQRTRPLAADRTDPLRHIAAAREAIKRASVPPPSDRPEGDPA